MRLQPTSANPWLQPCRRSWGQRGSCCWLCRWVREDSPCNGSWEVLAAGVVFCDALQARQVLGIAYVFASDTWLPVTLLHGMLKLPFVLVSTSSCSVAINMGTDGMY